MSEELKAKLLHFLSDEVELLEDFTLDMEEVEENDNKGRSRTTAIWAMQTTRVSAIRDVLELLKIEALIE